MNLEAVGVVRAVVLEAGLALLVASYFFERGERESPAFDTWFMAIAALAVMGYFNFGSFRYTEGLVHRHEQFHFYFGSKYLDEVRYDALYDATVAALAERDPRTAASVEPRDPMTFEIVANPLASGRAAEARARFSDERWATFSDEVEYFFGERRLGARVLTDHGNTGSPTWAMMASLLTRSLALDDAAMNVFALADIALMAIFFATVFWAFGRRVGFITLTVGLSVPMVHDWIGGSILRMDWVFALGMAACFLAKGRHAISGVFLGFAVATKLLAGLMVLPLGIAMLVETARERRLRREHVLLVSIALVSCLALVGASAAYFGGFQIWRDYDARMLVTLEEHYYSNQHSFRDVFLQLANVGSLRDLGWAPRTITASLDTTRIDDYAVAFTLARVALLLVIGWVASRHPIEQAIAFGPLAVYVVLVTNLYYWQITLFCALGFAQTYRTSPRSFGYLAATYVFVLSSLVFERTGQGRLLGYFGSVRLFWMCLALLLVELAHTERGRPIWARLRSWLASSHGGSPHRPGSGVEGSKERVSPGAGSSEREIEVELAQALGLDSKVLYGERVPGEEAVREAEPEPVLLPREADVG